MVQTTSISGFNIPEVEKRYGATFIGDFPVKLKGGNWGNPGAVFYQPNPDVSKGHKHLFGLVNTASGDFGDDMTFIYDASWLDGFEFDGVKQNDGSYAWSRYRHDYREVDGGFIDGGFDYFRRSTSLNVVKLKIEKDKVVEC